MRVLVTGANGFIGSHLTGALLEAGHGVLACVRNPGGFQVRFPSAQAIHCDLNRDTDPEAWRERLHGVDAVVNCAGILKDGFRQRAQRIHVQAPLALFEACRRAGVRRLVHVSAVSADSGAKTAYARTKVEAEQKLKEFDLDWIILRPSLVYAAGSYGGTSLLRGLAALPGFLPLVGAGTQPFRPIHARDLAIGIVRLLERPEISRVVLEPGGPEVLTLRAILLKLRAWLGLGRAFEISMPVWMLRVMARIGDLTGAITFNTTALRQLEYGNTGDPKGFTRISGLEPASMDPWLLRQPSHVQDRWHARLFWLVPCLRYALAILWIVSGFIGLLTGHFQSIALLSGYPSGLVVPLTLAFCALDIVIGAAILARWRPRVLGAIQLLVIAAYTIGISILAAWLWVNPLGPLLKNIPIIVAVGIWMVVEDNR